MARNQNAGLSTRITDHVPFETASYKSEGAVFLMR